MCIRDRSWPGCPYSNDNGCLKASPPSPQRLEKTPAATCCCWACRPLPRRARPLPRGPDPAGQPQDRNSERPPMSSLPAWLLLVVFLTSAGVIWGAGIKLSDHADVLAERLHLGTALGGVILLRIATNLPEIAIAVAAAIAISGRFVAMLSRITPPSAVPRCRRSARTSAWSDSLMPAPQITPADVRKTTSKSQAGRDDIGGLSELRSWGWPAGSGPRGSGRARLGSGRQAQQQQAAAGVFSSR